MQYRELVETVARRAGVSTDDAGDAADATLDALARTLDEPDRDLLLEHVPGKIKENIEAPGPAPDVESFVLEVSWLLGVEEPLARYRAQAVLSSVAEQEPDLISELHVPDSLQELFEEPPVEQAGPVLTDYEVQKALERLPYWTGDRKALRRFVVLPQENLDALLEQLRGLKTKLGRAPHIDRRAKDMAVLTVYTQNAEGVTAQDIELAHRVDEIIG